MRIEDAGLCSITMHLDCIQRFVSGIGNENGVVSIQGISTVQIINSLNSQYGKGCMDGHLNSNA